ncbi:unnamed protein product [Ilex paraguariensis]|uniref:MSP domain-containing protein n=1 Tax=Ilex paraguariensis TaxID=185542 RepID=A0ABC8U6W0_9AQUA
MAERKSPSDGRVWRLFKPPFRNSGASHSTTSSHSTHQQQQSLNNSQVERSNGQNNSSSSCSVSVSSVARSILPTWRRLRLDPSNKLYFPYEPGKQVRSAIRIKNSSKSHVAFKFQTTEPKSCFMRPPGAALAPGESLIATVFKFVEHPEDNEKRMEKRTDQKSNVKFKIMSLKVKGAMDYVPELFDEEKDQVAVEQILRVVFLDAARPSPALEKLKRQLAEAEAALKDRKKPPEATDPKIIGDGLAIIEWKERRKRNLARQQDVFKKFVMIRVEFVKRRMYAISEITIKEKDTWPNRPPPRLYNDEIPYKDEILGLDFSNFC